MSLFPSHRYAGQSLALVLGLAVLVPTPPAQAYVALMAGQRARALGGSFNGVPVLHSNQPEEVEGPGILINTAPGSAFAAETGRPLSNATHVFNGDFGLHFHHKYFPRNRGNLSPSRRRPQLTLAAILINPGPQPVHIQFSNGAVRNSFEAPYLANHLMGVRPLGPRPWNTGPGDATAVQMLRRKLDRRLAERITIPPRSRIILFQTALPALGIANALLRGRSDGPFHVAVVAAQAPRSDRDIFAVLDSGRLAPGRVYLRRIPEINRGSIFSRVGGVAVGDQYRASLSHDLQARGPLHVPFTSTRKHHFGTREIQVNPLSVRMADSALNNIGTYGVRFDIDLNLRGQGPHELVMSHPALAGRKPFTAFRGSLQIRTDEGLREVHVGLRSGQSLSLTQLDLVPGRNNPVKVSMVYPADATPGHLLSVVPSSQLARLKASPRPQPPAQSSPKPQPLPQPKPRPQAQPKPRPKPQPRDIGIREASPAPAPAPAAPPAPPSPRPPRGRPPAPAPRPERPARQGPLRPPSGRILTAPPPLTPPVSRPLAAPPPVSGTTPSLIERYRRAVEEQKLRMRRWQDP